MLKNKLTVFALMGICFWCNTSNSQYAKTADDFYVELETAGVIHCANQVLVSFMKNTSSSNFDLSPRVGSCRDYANKKSFTNSECSSISEQAKLDLDCKKINQIAQTAFNLKYTFYPETISIQFENLSPSVDKTLSNMSLTSYQMDYGEGKIKLNHQQADRFIYANIRYLANEIVNTISMAAIYAVIAEDGQGMMGEINPSDIEMSKFPKGLKKLTSLTKNGQIKAVLDKNQKKICEIISQEIFKEKVVEKKCSDTEDNYIIFYEP